jgi:hypothetical protein
MHYWNRVLGILFLLSTSACTSSIKTMPSPGMSLTPFDNKFTGWVTGRHCSNYLLGFRFPESPRSGPTGKRAGFLSGGALLSGQPPNSDAADALYQALKSDQRATHLLVPQYDIKSTGFPIIFTYPIFGKRCANVRALGLSVFDSGKRTDNSPQASPQRTRSSSGTLNRALGAVRGGLETAAKSTQSTRAVKPNATGSKREQATYIPVNASIPTLGHGECLVETTTPFQLKCDGLATVQGSLDDFGLLYFAKLGITKPTACTLRSGKKRLQVTFQPGYQYECNLKAPVPKCNISDA